MPDASDSDALLYRETQRFRQAWIWTLLATFPALMAWAFYQQIVLGRPWGTKPAPDWLVAALLAFSVLFLLFFASIELVVEVRPGRLLVRFFPFVRKEIPLSEIAHAEVRTYRPLVEYGGWGVRYGFRHGWAYNVSGNRGVQLTLAGGKRILVGSRRPEELAAALQAARTSAPPHSS